MIDEGYAHQTLAREGLITPAKQGWQPTKRLQGAVAKAAGDLVATGDIQDDLRLPFVMAVQEFFPAADVADLAAMTQVILELQKDQGMGEKA